MKTKFISKFSKIRIQRNFSIRKELTVEKFILKSKLLQLKINNNLP
jgi:hypothetical protein